MKPPFSLRSFLLASALLGAAQTASATDYTWTGLYTNGAWGQAANWSSDPTAPTFDASANILFSGTPPITATYLAGADRTVGSITFDQLDSAITIRLNSDGTSGGTARNLILGDASVTPTITVNDSTTNSAAVTYIIGQNGGNVVLANNLTIDVNSIIGANQTTLTINRPITETGGSFGLTKVGSGLLTLQGGAGVSNTYTGKTVVNGGRVRIYSGAGLGANPASFVADQLTLDGGSLYAQNVTDFGNRGITLGAGGGGFLANNGGNMTVNVPITGVGGLTQETFGVGYTLTLSAENSYQGATTISAGTLALGNNNVLPDTTDVSIANTAILNAAAFDDVVGTLDIAGSATINLGAGGSLAFTNSSLKDWSDATSLTVTGTFVSGSSLRFGTDASGLSLDQLSKITITGFTGVALDPATGFLTASPIVLTPADGTYASQTGAWNLPASWVDGIVANGADKTAYFINDVLAASTTPLGLDTTIGHLVFTDADNSTGNGFNRTLSGNILTLDVTTGAPTVTVNDTRALQINSTLAGNDGLTKLGQGTLILDVANTFTGKILVSEGTLRINTNVNRLGANPAVFTADHITLDGGRFYIGDAGTYGMGNRGITLAAGGGRFIANNGAGTITWNAQITGPGGFTLQTFGGNYTLVLPNAPTYQGDTTINGTSTLSLDAANENNELSTVTIATGAKLDLNFEGSDTVDKLFIGTTQKAAGEYKAIGSAATGTELAQLTGTGTLTVTSGPAGFSSWITGTFAGGATVPGDKQGPNDDADNDGIRNLVEYAIDGEDPTVPHAAIGSFDGTTLSFTKRAGTSGLTYAIQESISLGVAPNPWTEVSGGTYTNNATTITYALPAGGPAKNFLRLQVTTP